jgi:hypothetical protein
LSRIKLENSARCFSEATPEQNKKTPLCSRTGFAHEMWLYYFLALLEALSGLIFTFFSVAAAET